MVGMTIGFVIIRPDTANVEATAQATVESSNRDRPPFRVEAYPAYQARTGFLGALCSMLSAVAFFLLACPTLAIAGDRIVHVEGRAIHLNCTGEGAPTVVLEAGLSQGSLSWAWV